jgi:cytosine/adenosine deaminase-related metal-dependent hydrolase
MQIIYAGLALPATDKVETDYAVAVDDGRIIAVGDSSALTARFPDAERVGGREYLLMPGMINAHDHGRAVGAASLGIADDLLECWLPGLSAQPCIPPYLAAAYDGIQQLKSGVTGTAHSHNPATWEGMPEECVLSIQGYRDAGIRVAFHPPMVDQNPLIYADQDAFIAGLPMKLQHDARARCVLPPFTTEEYLALCDSLYERFHDAETHSVHVQISPAGGQWCSDGLTSASVEWAKARGTRAQMHMLETKYQRTYAYRTWGVSFIRHLDEVGALGSWLTLAHMVWADEDDFPLLAERGVGIAHNPSSNLRLRSGIAPIRRMQDAGVRIGVGLDGHALDDDQDYLRELRLAWALTNLRESAAPPADASAILGMAWGASAAMTFPGARLGTLDAGALADLVLLDFDAVRGAWASGDYPDLEDVPALLLHRAACTHVRHVMVGGRWCVRDGQCVTLDEAVVADEIRAALAAQDRRVLRERRNAAAALTPYMRRFYAGWQ